MSNTTPSFNYMSPILVNHVGYTPGASKICIIAAPREDEFSVYRLQDTSFFLVFKGKLTKGGDEAQSAWVGDFSSLRDDGIYRIQCGDSNSRCFVICQNVYGNPFRTVFNYFPMQRCGDSHTGWNAPCHVKEGVILDSGEYRDLSGGYHQSGDTRKSTWGLGLGMIGLFQAGLSEKPHWDTGLIADEIRWGCDYFHRMQRDDGGIMDTSSLPEGWSEGLYAGRKGFADYDLPWKAREFYKSDTMPPAQWNNARFQAMAHRYFKDKNPEYAGKCLDSSIKSWCHMTSPERSYKPFVAEQMPPLGHDGMNVPFAAFYKGSALELSHRLCAGISLYRATCDVKYLDDASACATGLVGLQFEGDVAGNPATACFKEGKDSLILANSYFYYWNTSGPVGLCDMLELAPTHPDAPKWMESVRRIAEQYAMVSERNPFQRVPAVWYHEDHNPFSIPAFFSFSTSVGTSDDEYPAGKVTFGGEAKDRNIRYKYYNFCYNLDLQAAAIFLKKASGIFNDNRYADLAQSQLDWILGVNPFDSSSVEAVGYNQPHRGLFGEFFPCTPQIPGAVSTGISPHSFDPKGFGLDNEYDMPMVGWMMWLLSEMGRP